jgi:hypothetical protein
VLEYNVYGSFAKLLDCEPPNGGELRTFGTTGTAPVLITT